MCKQGLMPVCMCRVVRMLLVVQRAAGSPLGMITVSTIII